MFVYSIITQDQGEGFWVLSLGNWWAYLVLLGSSSDGVLAWLSRSQEVLVVFLVPFSIFYVVIIWVFI